MNNAIINISEKYSLPGNATLEYFVHSDNKEMHDLTQKLPCMLVCPGGGYGFVSEREAEPIAIDFYNRMYNAFVLTYSIAPDYRYPVALSQLACSIDYIRKHAEELCVDPDKIYVVGFSAGGHLVGNIANAWHSLPDDYFNPEDIDAQPNAVVLSYPVIYPHSHLGSYKNLLGDNYENSPFLDALSLDKSASEKNPPCFIWTTGEDTCVNPDATLRYAQAMYEHKIKFECHVFPTGWHGGATCDDRTNKSYDALTPAAIWLDLADRFLKNL